MTLLYHQAGPSDVTGQGHFMATKAWLDFRLGNLKAITQLWTTNHHQGFAGLIDLVLLGIEGRPLGYFRAIQGPWGVEAGHRPSSRQVVWSYDLDPELAHRISQVGIIHCPGV